VRTRHSRLRPRVLREQSLETYTSGPLIYNNQWLMSPMRASGESRIDRKHGLPHLRSTPYLAERSFRRTRWSSFRWPCPQRLALRARPASRYPRR
jgi:hypothetical protein